MKFLKNINYNNIDKGIEYLKTNKFNYYLPEGEKTIYHVLLTYHGTYPQKKISIFTDQIEK